MTTLFENLFKSSKTPEQQETVENIDMQNDNESQAVDDVQQNDEQELLESIEFTFKNIQEIIAKISNSTGKDKKKIPNLSNQLVDELEELVKKLRISELPDFVALVKEYYSTFTFIVDIKEAIRKNKLAPYKINAIQQKVAEVEGILILENQELAVQDSVVTEEESIVKPSNISSKNPDTQPLVNEDTPIQDSSLKNIDNQLAAIKSQGGECLDKINIVDTQSINCIDDIHNLSNKLTTSTEDSTKKLTAKIEQSKSELRGQLKNLGDDVFQVGQQIDRLEVDQLKSRIEQINRSMPTGFLTKSDLEDFEFRQKQHFNGIDDLKEGIEVLESIPHKIDEVEHKLVSISDKLENLPAGGNTTTQTNVPSEGRAVADLAQYMRDGIDQFENMSRLFVDKMAELNKLDEIKAKHNQTLEEVKQDSYDNGMTDQRVKLAEQIAEQFPTTFLEIRSIFGDLITEKFIVNDEIEVNNDNKDEFALLIEGELNLGDYQVVSSAILFKGKPIVKAKVLPIPGVMEAQSPEIEEPHSEEFQSKEPQNEEPQNEESQNEELQKEELQKEGVKPTGTIVEGGR